MEKYAFLRQIVEVDVLACLDQGDLVGLALGSFDALVRLDHHLVDEHLAATWTAIIVQLQASPSLYARRGKNIYLSLAKPSFVDRNHATF